MVQFTWPPGGEGRGATGRVKRVCDDILDEYDLLGYEATNCDIRVSGDGKCSGWI